MMHLHKDKESFSEDIDINYATNIKPTQGEKREFKKKIIIAAINNAKLELLNPKDIRLKKGLFKLLI